MAPGSLSPVYLPEIGRCLEGELLLPSWDDLLDALFSHDDTKANLAVEILSGDRPKKILSQPYPCLPKPSSSSKTAFDTSTGGIKPSSDALYNVDEIKADALWLSKQVNLDEVEALRYTVLEWQYQPESRLREGYSEAELASLKDALGSDYVDKQLQSLQSGARNDTVFNSQSCRRTRLLRRFLQDKATFLRIRRALLDASLLPESALSVPSQVRVLARDLKPEARESLDEDVEAGLEGIQGQLHELQGGRKWDIDEAQTPILNDMADTVCLQNIGTILEIVLLQVRQSKDTVSSDTLLHWLQFMSSVGFFSSFTSQLAVQLEAIQKLQALGSFVLAALLDLASTIASLNETASSGQPAGPSRIGEYFYDIDSFHEIHEILFNQTTIGNTQAGLAILPWAIILHQIWIIANAVKEARESHHAQKAIDGVTSSDSATGRRSSASSGASIQQSIFEDLLDRIPTSSNEDPSSPLLDTVIDQCNVFDYIAFLSTSKSDNMAVLSAYKLQTLQELVTVSQSFLGYTPELVIAQLALLSNTSTDSSKKWQYDPAVDFVEDKFLLEGFYDVSAARFPYECLPFLQFSRALAKANVFNDQGSHFVEYRLRNLTTFTQAAVRDIKYKIIREDESDSYVALENPVNMLDLTKTKILGYTGQNTQSLSILPADVTGQVISDPDSQTKIIRWQTDFSGLAYIGQLLEIHYMRMLSTCLSPHEDSQAVVSECISLLTTLLSTIISNTADDRSREEVQQHCNSILGETSSHLHTDANVVSLIFELLEQELQSFRQRSVSTFDCRILLACVDFVVILCKIQPHLVWSGINRTSLLGRQLSSTYIVGIVSAVEIPLRSFDVLESCARLYEALVQLALQSQSHTLARIPSSSARRASMLPTATRMQTSILLSSTNIMFDILQGIPDWSFRSAEQQTRISAIITGSFANVIRFAYDVGDALSSPVSAGNVFVEAAKFIISSFRSESFNDVAIMPIAKSLFKAGTSSDLFTRSEDLVNSEIGSTLSLATLLTRYGLLLGLPLSSAEMHIFNAIPSLVRILQDREPVRTQCCTLIRAVMTYADRHQPSSLLGHLGSVSCIDLLHTMKHIGLSAQSPEQRSESWKFLTMLVKDSQQWFAMVALTGAAPDGSRRTLSEESPKKCFRGKNLLQIAIEELDNIHDLPQVVGISILEFLLEAQQNWAWVTNELNLSQDFFSKLVSFVAEDAPRQNDETDFARHNTIAALVADLSNNHLHHAKVARDLNATKAFIPLIDWLRESAIDVSSYNLSLHRNLRKNFSDKYSGFSITDFKRAGLSERVYGPTFFYDVDYADQVFAGDSRWRGGGGRSASQSYSAEFQKANTNLSLVDSELKLLLSLQRLCVDHCRLFTQDKELQKVMAHIVRNCLEANTRLYPEEVIFDSLFQTRADLATALLGELISAGAKGDDFLELVTPAWDAVRARNGSYEQAIINGDLTYWRSTLYILFMTVQFHVRRKLKPTTIPGTNKAIVPIESTNTAFLEITTEVVAKAFETVVAGIQEQKLSKTRASEVDESNIIGPRDVTLLVMLMQAIFRLPSLSQFATELSARIVNSGLISSCLLLYSWSHILAGPETETQPRYAEFCVLLLASISSLPAVAEHLAVEGVLSRLLTAKSTESLQRVPGGALHVDSRPGCGTLYRIWATGIMPLCLNLLHAVGGAIAPEISMFLNQFPNQLLRASTSFMLTPQTKADGTDVLTLTVASEAGTLALISHILSSYREAGASAAVDPLTVLPLKGYDEHRKAIAEDVREILTLKEDVRRKMTVPSDEREWSLQNSKEGDQLDARIVKELKIALAALRRDDDDDEK
ncbi:nucleoporin subcomplex protein binding to Pom34-domain-containing protein [Exophiala viscosa]|uniref:Nucleoporin subcomplex protein binding to Pom34-domain-containing protein n=1 Tax=Exophiala viscosa TaxID=2486360 RepID=A0AAN6DZP6_9EURO|nr:nucleoporin subcomplex protein binding to Pom34-domain-containing protein [Exophiala viscosa]KAI1622233.1 nucleoporin subcomplex protein binding to Pom34-domain-containing protein [Exophiala viscosa]